MVYEICEQMDRQTDPQTDIQTRWSQYITSLSRGSNNWRMTIYKRYNILECKGALQRPLVVSYQCVLCHSKNTCLKPASERGWVCRTPKFFSEPPKRNAESVIYYLPTDIDVWQKLFIIIRPHRSTTYVDASLGPPDPHPKRHLDRFSPFCTDHHRVFLYFAMDRMWGAHWRNLVDTIEPLIRCGDASFLSDYFDHLLLLHFIFT